MLLHFQTLSKSSFTANFIFFFINQYQHLVGKPIYLTITQHNITYTISFISQFMHASTVFYLSLVKRILHYLKGSVGREIIMTNNGGFYVFVGGNLIS